METKTKKEKEIQMDLSKVDKIIITPTVGMTKASFGTIFWTIMTIFAILGIVIRIHLNTAGTAGIKACGDMSKDTCAAHEAHESLAHG